MIIRTQKGTRYEFKDGNVRITRIGKPPGYWQEATLMYPPVIGVPAMIWHPDKEKLRRTSPVEEIWKW